MYLKMIHVYLILLKETHTENNENSKLLTKYWIYFKTSQYKNSWGILVL